MTTLYDILKIQEKMFGKVEGEAFDVLRALANYDNNESKLNSAKERINTQESEMIEPMIIKKK